jgi:hypothetical protein
VASNPPRPDTMVPTAYSTATRGRPIRLKPLDPYPRERR